MPSFDLGEFHPAIIHFPIALAFIILISDILYWFTTRELFQTMASWLLIIFAVILIPTAITGLLAKEAYPPDDPDVFRHQTMAIITVIYTIAYALFRGNALFHQRFHSAYLYILLSLINVGLVYPTAEFGGIVVRGKGIVFDSMRPTGTPLPYNEVK